ncbi:MAG: hypothetical protein DRQ62_13700 [Gammaproteobacteria bacterium]|nr:MAG: hypothetical protein DRQ62_13700 [Gammaproteobacteria bacterium]
MTKTDSNIIALPKKQSSKLKFTTKRVIDLASPEKGQRYYYDSEVGGLGVRVSASGSRTYILYKKVNGKPQRITLGKVGVIGLAEARKAAIKLNGEVAGGIDIVKAKKEAKVKQITVGELYKAWLATAHKLDLKSVGDDETRWRLHLSKLARKTAVDITRADLQRIVDRISKKAKRQANLCCDLMHRVYAHAIRAETFKGDNPAKGLIRNREQSRERYLKPDEIKGFIESVRAEGEPWTGYFMMLLLTGQRREAVATMRWQDVDLKAGVWSLPSWSSKNGRSLSIALTVDAVELLNGLQDYKINQYVFGSTRSKSGHIINPVKAFKRICERAGVSDLRIHDVRRSVGSWMAAAGASNFMISKALGHADTRSAQVYARLDVDPVRTVLEDITGQMLK